MRFMKEFPLEPLISEFAGKICYSLQSGMKHGTARLLPPYYKVL